MGAWQLTLKDLRLLVRDWQALVLLLVLPMVFISILGLSTGKLLGWQEANQRLQLAVVDEDQSELSAEIIASLKNREGVELLLVPDAAQARTMVDRKQCTAALILGKEFHVRVEEMKVADVLDTDRGKLAGGLDALDIRVEQKQLFRSTGAIVRQLILAEATRIITPHVVRGNPFISNLMNRILAAREAELEEAGMEPGPAHASQTTSRPAEPPSDSQGIYEILVPAYTVMFVFFMILIMARSFLTERELGTLRRLRLAPLAPSEILIGKTLPFFLLSLAQSAILFLSGRLIFGMSWGPQPWLLIPIIVSTSLAATSLGLLVATVVRTDSQVSAYSDFLVITMAAISGVFMPRDWLPWTMQQISLVTPHSWALIAYDEVLAREVVSVTVVARCCAAELGFALIYFLLGWWRFRTVR